ALPSSLLATLTWDPGSNQRVATMSYNTTGRSPGESFTLALQVPAPGITTTGRYAWNLDIGTPDGTKTVSGTAFVVSEDADALGDGWPFARTDRLVDISSAPAGKLRVYGTGGWRFYQQNGGGFDSPAGDNGTLSTDGSGWKYTTPDGQVWKFNS